jgi:pyruvate dehydrogenase E2 component (dihydrolipoamide acetyltransferase)
MPEVVMPRIDPGMQTGKIVEWLKKEGELVQKGEPILVVEGEKTTFEIEAPESGILSRILVDIGSDVQVAEPVAVIGEPGEGAQTATRTETAQDTSTTSTTVLERTQAPTPGDRVIASPAARKLAKDLGVDIAKLKGTGPGGRITREDVQAALERPQPQTAGAVPKVREPTVSKKEKLSGIRKVVAERLTFSARTGVPVILTMETDATKLIELKNKETHVGFTAFAVKAAATALEKNLLMNSTFEGDEVTTYSDVNVAVAINTEQGLVAPVVQNANKKTLNEINAAIEALSQKARENRLSIEELTGGTFTVTNLGAHDVETFAPVINPSQCAILGLGRIAYKPFVSGERVIGRPATLLTLVFDHRIVDGVPAAKFLREVKRNLEDPETLL